MDNGQLARWVARVEHFERIESQRREEAFLRDIHPDDQETNCAPDPAQGIMGMAKMRLNTLSTRLGLTRKTAVAECPQGCVSG